MVTKVRQGDSEINLILEKSHKLDVMGEVLARLDSSNSRGCR
jgi:hypothetical protein